tara:strand:+ start:1128 stop:1484 length:357 start_codon:yes stop_codon:yes gene_type:complete
MIKKVFNFLYEVLGMPYYFVINLFKGMIFATKKTGKGFLISAKFTAKQIIKFIKSIPGMLVILAKWFLDAIKESIAQIFTLLGFFIAWFTLTGTAQDIVGIAIVVSVIIWLVTIRLRD